jgi:hypothetical protein
MQMQLGGDPRVANPPNPVPGFQPRSSQQAGCRASDARGKRTREDVPRCTLQAQTFAFAGKKWRIPYITVRKGIEITLSASTQ